MPQGDYDTVEKENERRKMRLVISISFLSGLLCFVLPFVSFMMVGAFDVADPVTISFGVVLMLNPYLLKRTGNIKIPATIFVSLIFLVTFGLSLLMDGLSSQTMPFFLLRPLATTFLLGSRAGFTMALIGAAATVAFYFSRATLSTWNVLPEDVNLMMYTICFVVACFLITIFSLFYETFQARSNGELASMVEKLQQTNMDDYVGKPVKLESLVAVIQRVCESV